MNILAKLSDKRNSSDWPPYERSAWGEGYVCSVVPSIRCGARRLKDDGAPPFFPAIGRQFSDRQRRATPNKIVTPIAAGAVASRSLTRHTPHRAVASPFQSSGGDDGALRPNSGTSGRTVGVLQQEGNPADQARTGSGGCRNGADQRGVRYRDDRVLTVPSRSGGECRKAASPLHSGHRAWFVFASIGVLSRCGTSSWIGANWVGLSRHEGVKRGWRDKRGAGHGRLCGCGSRACMSDTHEVRPTGSHCLRRFPRHPRRTACQSALP